MDTTVTAAPTDVRKRKIDPRQLAKLSHRAVKVSSKVVFVYVNGDCRKRKETQSCTRTRGLSYNAKFQPCKPPSSGSGSLFFSPVTIPFRAVKVPIMYTQVHTNLWIHTDNTSTLLTYIQYTYNIFDSFFTTKDWQVYVLPSLVEVVLTARRCSL